LRGFNCLLISLFILTFTQAQSWQNSIYPRIVNHFLKQGRFVTGSVKILQVPRISDEEIERIELPERLRNGYHRLTIFLNDQRQKTIKIKVNLQERIPVTKVSLKPEDYITTQDIEEQWLNLDDLTDFVVRKPTELVGLQSKYFKNAGAFFYRHDVKRPVVIQNQAVCTIHLHYRSVTITMPGLALKNGSVGSKINVLNRMTEKILEAVVIDSRNVEVRI